MKKLIIILGLSLSLVNAGVIRVNQTNPRYFDNGDGRAICLSGFHTWNNFQNLSSWINYGFTNAVNDSVFWGANSIRLWNFEAMDTTYFKCPTNGWGTVSPLPWGRSGTAGAHDGGNKFDLTTYNSTYFTLLSNNVQYAQSQGIYTIFMFFEAIEPVAETNWWWAPENRTNNINNTLQNSSDLYTLNDAAMTGILTNYVRKVIDTLNGFDNLLWEVGNEHQGYSSNFVSYIIDVVKAYELTKAKQHPICYSAFASEINGPILASTNADFISPGQSAYIAPAALTNATRPFWIDTDHIWQVSRIDPEWFWRMFFHGYHVALMDAGTVHCENLYTNSGGWSDSPTPKTRQAVGQIALWSSRIGLVNMVPSPTNSSYGYCLINPGVEYLALAPNPSASFTLYSVAGTYYYQWFLLESAKFLGEGTRTLTNGNNTFVPPTGYYGSSILWLKAQ